MFHVYLCAGFLVLVTACGSQGNGAGQEPAATTVQDPDEAPSRPEGSPTTEADPVVEAPGPAVAEEATEAPPVTPDTRIALLEREVQDGEVIIEEEDGFRFIYELVVFGRSHVAEPHCTDVTRVNPDDLISYAIEGRPEIVFHCPGGLDGDMNAVTVFAPGPDSEPQTQRVRPDPSSHIITTEVLTQTVKQLLMAGARAD